MKNRVLLISLPLVLALSVGLVACAGEVVPEHSLTISSTEGGSVTSHGEPGPYIYDEGEVVHLIAEAEDGYQFVSWTGDVGEIADLEDASTTITMNGNYTITASFGPTPPAQYDLTISSAIGGSVTGPGEGTFTYDAGTVVNIVATRASGYRFLHWTGDLEGIADINAASTTITIYDNYSITANFLETVEIWDWYDLHAVRDGLGGDYLLIQDLDAAVAGYAELAGTAANAHVGWQPIGTEEQPFIGNFDGQGHEICDLYIYRPDEEFVGLFGFAAQGAVVRNLGVVNATISGSSYVGTLTGQNGGNVSDSYCSSIVINGEAVGGLVGVDVWQGNVNNAYYNYDEVLINGENIITIGALFNEDFEQWLANDKFLDVNERLTQEDGFYLINSVSDFKELLAFGQDDSLRFRLKEDLDLCDETNFCIPYLAGEFDGNGHRISNLSFSSPFISHVGLFGHLAPGGTVTELSVEDVDLIGLWYVGGLVGANSGTVANSHATGSVTGHWDVGGLVGINWWGAVVSNSYSTATVNSVWSAGGLVGFSDWDSTVSNSYSTGAVTGRYWVGGLAGGSDGIVQNSYSTGRVIGEATVGGLVGRLWFGGTVINCHSVGRVTGTHASIGGLVGSLAAPGEGDPGIVSGSFWDTQTSGQATSAGGIGKTTAEMKTISTFSSAGWNIAGIAPGDRNTAYTWNIVDGQTYPFLSWQP